MVTIIARMKIKDGKEDADGPARPGPAFGDG